MNEKVCPTSNRHIVWFIFFRTDMSIRGDTSWLTYTPVFPIFYKITKTILHSPHFITIIFVRLFCKLSSSGSSDLYHFGGTRSILSWETVVHYPRYKLRGQIRLKDTTLSLGSDLLSNYCLYCRFVSFIFFLVSVFLNEHEYIVSVLRTNTGTTILRRIFFFRFCSNQFVSVERTLLLVTIFRFCSNFIFFRFCSFLYCTEI